MHEDLTIGSDTAADFRGYARCGSRGLGPALANNNLPVQQKTAHTFSQDCECRKSHSVILWKLTALCHTSERKIFSATLAARNRPSDLVDGGADLFHAAYLFAFATSIAEERLKWDIRIIYQMTGLWVCGQGGSVYLPNSEGTRPLVSDNGEKFPWL